MIDDFRILAIQPLPNCNKRFSKNLDLGKIYKFYDEYIFLDENEKKVESFNDNLKTIKKVKEVPEGLYNLDNGLKVNISAIVGKNGSGKSTLLELYYAICFSLACKAEIIETHRNEDNRNKKQEEWFNYVLDLYKDLKVRIYYSYQTKIYCLEASDSFFSLLTYRKDGDNYIYEEAMILATIQEFKSFLNQKFPYTIAINYSLYGLNSEFMGPWVEKLFHKNDGYQTPVVINPFRTEGNIDVNNELHLAQTRLMTNMVKDENNKEINGQLITHVVYEKDNKKYQESIDKPDYYQMYSDFKKTNEIDDLDFLREVDNLIYNRKKGYEPLEEITNNSSEELGFLANYIFLKILKISRYPDYATINLKTGQQPNYRYFQNFCLQLSDDKTHITYKLRQVLNMLRFHLVPDSWQKLYGGNRDKEYKKIGLDELIMKLQEIHENNTFLQIEEFLPIGCYNVILQAENDINFAGMSSGEQHFVHSLHSILYHILNVDSVFNNANSNRISYPYINIILDEIELYYHPEFQRKFVEELLQKLNGQPLNHIQGINILCSTHSPFILSDIPKQNILRLKNGKVIPHKVSHQTLGANIHELLYNDFFLEASFMGEFVKKKILDLIDHLKSKKDEYRRIKENQDIKGFKWDDTNSKLFIEQVGEPVLKDSLLKLYYQKYKMTPEMIDKEIERLQKMKNRE